MTESQQDPVSESQIAVHWREEEYIYPPQSFIDQANANDPAIFDRFDEKKFPDCFVEYAELRIWDKKQGKWEHPGVFGRLRGKNFPGLLRRVRGAPQRGKERGQGREPDHPAVWKW